MKILGSILTVLISLALCTGADKAAPEKARLKGTVVDSAGSPVKDAVIEVYSSTDPRSILGGEQPKPLTVAATNGSFDVEVSLFAVIVAKKEGLAPDWRTFYGIEAGEEQEVKLVLGHSGTLGGMVVDPSGKPVPGAKVFISMASLDLSESGGRQMGQLAGKPLKDSFTTRTDGNGKFRITGFPTNATARLEAKAPGMALKVDAAGNPFSQKFQWTAGQEDIRLEMELTGVIEGKIAAEKAGQPIPSAMISLQPSSPYSIGTTVGDKVSSLKDGTFRIVDVPPGSYLVRAEFGTNALAEWVAEPAAISVESSETNKLEKPLTATQGGVAEITVLDSKSRLPLKSVQVYAYADRMQTGATTDENGKALMRLVPQKYQFIALTTGGQSMNMSETISEGATNQVELEARSPSMVKGVVRTADGKPAANVQIWVVGGQGSGKRIKTDNEGKFQAVTSSPIQQQEQAPVIVARDVEKNLAAAQEVADEAENVELKLEPGSILSGRAECAGAPVSDATIALIYWNGNRGTHLQDFSKKSDKPGSFEIRALPKNTKYGIVVSARGYGSRQVHSLTTGTSDDRIDAGTLELNKANLQLAGTVVDADDKPVKGASVNLSGDGQPSGHVQTDKEGRFIFKEVCEGTARLFASGNQSSGNVSASGGETNVVIRLGQNTSYSSGEASHKLHGRVTAAGDKSVAGAKAAVFPSSMSGAWSTIKEDGAYSIRWSAQPWQLESGDPVLVVRLPEQGLAAAETFSAEATNLDVQLKPAWTVKGRVEDAQGKPLPKTQISLQFLAGRSYSNLDAKELLTDSDGKFEIKAVPPGPDYYITANLKGYSYVRRQLEAEAEQGEVVVEPIKLILADKVVAGQVLDANDKPAAMAHVQIMGENQPQTYEQTDKNGRFKFAVCDGEVRLWANGQNSYGEVTVTAGDTNVVINLQSYDSPRQAVSQRASLKGKPLPDCAGVGLAADALPSAKPALLCLVDAEQRPSRRAVKLLGEQNAALKEKGIAILCVQAVPTEDSVFTEWTNSAALPFAVGRVTEKTAANKWATEVKSFPWLILRDAKGNVVDEGFSIEDLESKIAALKP